MSVITTPIDVNCGIDKSGRTLRVKSPGGCGNGFANTVHIVVDWV